jgi:glutathione S-transferase
MIVVHHLNNSRSQRVLWLLEELGLPYEVKRYQRDRKTMLAPPELRAVHPLGKSPVIEDDGQVLAESGAIIEYLAERYGDGRLVPEAGTPEQCATATGCTSPKAPPSRRCCSSCSSTAWRRGRCRSSCGPSRAPLPGAPRPAYIQPNIDRNLDFMESELATARLVRGCRVQRRGRADELSA